MQVSLRVFLTSNDKESLTLARRAFARWCEEVGLGEAEAMCLEGEEGEEGI